MDEPATKSPRGCTDVQISAAGQIPPFLAMSPLGILDTSHQTHFLVTIS
jgi:hypothetical protein